MKNPTLSVIILNFNTKDLLAGCLSSVLGSAGFEKGGLEIIVVDNASTDGSVEMLNNKFPHLKVIRNKINVGFSAGNNIGIAESEGKYILLLNSDTKVEPNTIRGMIDFMDEDKLIGAATCKLELGDGSLDFASHRGFPTPWNSFFYFILPLARIFPKSGLFGGYHQGWKDFSVPHEVDVISGAFFMVKRSVIRKVGLLDERFFMYGEDIDWCYRIKKEGYKIMYNPHFKTVHYKKQSGRSCKNDRTLRKKTHSMFAETMGQFYMKHYVEKYPKLLTWLVKLGIGMKKII